MYSDPPLGVVAAPIGIETPTLRLPGLKPLPVCARFNSQTIDINFERTFQHAKKPKPKKILGNSHCLKPHRNAEVAHLINVDGKT